jgi:hypothetical protein
VWGLRCCQCGAEVSSALLLFLRCCHSFLLEGS